MIASPQSFLRRRRSSGISLIELMVAVALGGVLAAAAGSLWLFGSRSFVSMANYADLDSRSRNAVDRMSREIRQATQVTAFDKSGTKKLLSVTNALEGTETTYTWEAASRTLVAEKTGEPDEIYLTECDSWDFELYQRTPQTGGDYAFFPATNAMGDYDVTICKLIDMNWKCGRTIMGTEANTETMQTAQVVLRNKQ